MAPLASTPNSERCGSSGTGPPTPREDPFVLGAGRARRQDRGRVVPGNRHPSDTEGRGPGAARAVVVQRAEHRDAVDQDGVRAAGENVS
jgi:hypothetical protein